MNLPRPRVATLARTHRFKPRATVIWMLSVAGAVVFFTQIQRATAEPRASATQPAGSAKADAELAVGKLEAGERRVMDLKNRYEIELRSGMADIKVKNVELAEFGGVNLGQDGYAKAIEMKRWVLEQADLQSQVLAIDIDLAQFNDKKAAGEGCMTVSAPHSAG